MLYISKKIILCNEFAKLKNIHLNVVKCNEIGNDVKDENERT